MLCVPTLKQDGCITWMVSSTWFRPLGMSVIITFSTKWDAWQHPSLLPFFLSTLWHNWQPVTMADGTTKSGHYCATPKHGQAPWSLNQKTYWPLMSQCLEKPISVNQRDWRPWGSAIALFGLGCSDQLDVLHLPGDVGGAVFSLLSKHLKFRISLISNYEWQALLHLWIAGISSM